jgi:hypothetical protein
MKNSFSRRNFIQTGALMATACVASSPAPTFAVALPETGKPSPIKLGICSYTFRNFTRAQMLGYLKELRLTDLNVKDTKDHLPMDPTLEAQALADYTVAGVKLHAAGAIYFPKDDESDIRGKFEYCKRAGIDHHRRRRSYAGVAEVDREVRQGIRHQDRDPQSWPRGQVLPVAV